MRKSSMRRPKWKNNFAHPRYKMDQEAQTFFIPFDAVQGLTKELHWLRCFPDHDMIFGRMTGGEDSGLRLVVCPAGTYT